MKKHLMNFIKAVCFVLVLSLVLSLASKYIVPKKNNAEAGMYDPKTRGYISEPENTFDVLVMGNSDARCGFSPNELWHEFGFASVVVGQNRQTPAMMYTLFKSFVKTQKPKVVILDTDIFFATASATKRSERSLEALTEYAFPIFRNHDLWKRQTLKTLFTKPEYTEHFFIKGQDIFVQSKPDKKGERIPNKKEFLTPDTVIFTDLVLNYCKNNGIKIFFIEMPTTTSWNMSRHIATKAYADKRGIEFLDMQVNRVELGFDFKTDTRDGGSHLNYDGAKKATKIIGDYLKENYSEVIDRRNDPAYKSWDDDYAEYTKYVDGLKKKYEKEKKAEKEKAEREKAKKAAAKNNNGQK